MISLAVCVLIASVTTAVSRLEVFTIVLKKPFLISELYLSG